MPDFQLAPIPASLLEAYREAREVDNAAARELIYRESFRENLKTLLEWNGIIGYDDMIHELVKFCFREAEVEADD